MRIGEPVEWALHCVVVLDGLPDDRCLTAGRLAEYHGVPAAYLAKALQALSQAGIVEAVTGRRGGYRLARRSADISMLDVVVAVEGDEPAFRCQEIRRRAPIEAERFSPVCAIAAAMRRAESAWRDELAAVTVADITAALEKSIPRVARLRSRSWIDRALS